MKSQLPVAYHQHYRTPLSYSPRRSNPTGPRGLSCDVQELEYIACFESREAFIRTGDLQLYLMSRHGVDVA
jgi:hypothetical protein